LAGATLSQPCKYDKTVIWAAAICRHRLSRLALGGIKKQDRLLGLAGADKLESTMNIKTLTGVALIAVAALTSTAAFAAGPHTLMNGSSLLGVPALAERSSKVLDVASTPSANVICGDVVTFRNGAKTFTWKFDGVSHRTVDLQKIAPAGFTSKPLLVYVEPNAYERG
jgi:hypothetical protein